MQTKVGGTLVSPMSWIFLTKNHLILPYFPPSSFPGKSERDVTEFVKYLLEGSGAEANVDFAALRRDLEGTSVNLGEQPSNTNNSSNILDAMSFATSPASKKFYKELSSSSSSTGGGVEINTADQAEVSPSNHRMLSFPGSSNPRLTCLILPFLYYTFFFLYPYKQTPGKKDRFEVYALFFFEN